LSFPYRKITLRTMVVGAALLMAMTSCKREKRELHPAPHSAMPSQAVQMTALHAGGQMQAPNTPFELEKNAYAVSQGQQLFSDFNCVGCHAMGGGDIGPPLDDNKWIYGSDPEQIYASIVEGRPNGMPSFRERITDDQVWQLVAYVRILGGLGSSQAAPGRDDHMKTGEPPNSSESQTPVKSSLPRSAQMPQ
jgi:cytochrome c oxidase cbb3-type subunit 3